MTSTPLRAVGLLERAVGYTRSCLALVSDPLLDRPTPCAAWDLRALLAHMDDSLAAFTEAAALGEVASLPAAPPGSRLPAEVLVDRLRVRACAVLGEWVAGPQGPSVTIGEGRVDAGVLAGVGALEIAVHGWDVAQACGADLPLPGPLAEELLPLAGDLVGADDRPLRFGPERVPLRDGDADRLLALLGR